MHRKLFVVLVSLVALACQSGAAVGASCARNAECSSPLVCRLGRCRSECATDRDCPVGATCLYGVDGLGSCSLATELTCTPTSCPSELVCTVYGCRDVCTDLCHGGNVCVGGACLASASDGGVSDASGGVSDASVDGGVSRARYCSRDSDCELTDRCVEAYSLRSCRAPCVDTSQCAGNGSCTTASVVGGTGTASICTEDCTPGTSDGCLPGSTCTMWNFGQYYTFCRGVSGAVVGEGCTCQDGAGSTDCELGLVCGRDRADLVDRCVHACASGDTCAGGPCFIPNDAVVHGGRQWGFCPVGPAASCR